MARVPSEKYTFKHTKATLSDSHYQSTTILDTYKLSSVFLNTVSRTEKIKYFLDRYFKIKSKRKSMPRFKMTKLEQCF